MKHYEWKYVMKYELLSYVIAMTILKIKSILLKYCYCSTSYFYVGGLHSFYNVITYQRRWKL